MGFQRVFVVIETLLLPYWQSIPIMVLAWTRKAIRDDQSRELWWAALAFIVTRRFTKRRRTPSSRD